MALYDEVMAYAATVVPEFENRRVEARLSKYVVGDYLERHRDITAHRKNTVIIQLSEPSSYEGGDLYVHDALSSREQGATVIFDSQTVWHSVSEITGGVRYSLVFWSYEIPLDKTAD